MPSVLSILFAALGVIALCISCINIFHKNIGILFFLMFIATLAAGLILSDSLVLILSVFCFITSIVIPDEPSL